MTNFDSEVLEVDTDVSTTTFPVESTTELTEIDRLEQQIPWLNNILVGGSGNDTVTTQKGTPIVGIEMCMW